MPFPNPLTWLDGLRRLRARKPLPTSLGSRDIQTRLGADLKRWSVFSAKSVAFLLIGLGGVYLACGLLDRLTGCG